MAEFTGERVIPGQVDDDLWNEHLSRYLFAARLSRGKRVLDIGCGTGYGTAKLATEAVRVYGLDVAPEAVQYASTTFRRPNTEFLQATGTQLPLASGTLDLVVAFEMIEHLANWTVLLEEVTRVLKHSGQFVVSTPNKQFYAEFRRHSGPNPYHVHEFDFEEFRAELGKYFPQVSLFSQNHSPSIVFQPVDATTGAQVQVDAGRLSPEDSSFFIAVCAATPQTGSPTFVHVPTSANVLRERSQHIVLLEQELATKNQWLETSKAEHQKLVEKHRELQAELEKQNKWADELDAELAGARKQIDRIHAEKDAEIVAIASGYEEQVARLEQESEKHSRWAMKTQQELNKSVELLDKAEQSVKERTEWALKLDAEVEALRAKISMVEASRWVRIGRRIGLGPATDAK